MSGNQVMAQYMGNGAPFSYASWNWTVAVTPVSWSVVAVVNSAWASTQEEVGKHTSLGLQRARDRTTLCWRAAV